MGGISLYCCKTKKLLDQIIMSLYLSAIQYIKHRMMKQSFCHWLIHNSNYCDLWTCWTKSHATELAVQNPISRVPTPPGKSWMRKFLKNHSGPGKSWELKLEVLESPRKISLKIVHFCI